MSKRTEKSARLNALRLAAGEAERLAAEGNTESSARSIALSLATLVGFNAEDAATDWERDREREKAFGAELERLATGDGAALPPKDRTRCLSLLAQWISEGYDGPPTADDYRDVLGASDAS